LIAAMPQQFLPGRAVLWHTAETLAIAAAGGILLTWLGFPAGLVTGSLLGVAVAALAGRPVDVPASLAMTPRPALISATSMAGTGCRRCLERARARWRR
jgi:uncharacterized membrane protein AbrB (regulator of aidB expression)